MTLILCLKWKELKAVLNMTQIYLLLDKILAGLTVDICDLKMQLLDCFCEKAASTWRHPAVLYDTYAMSFSILSSTVLGPQDAQVVESLALELKGRQTHVLQYWCAKHEWEYSKETLACATEFWDNTSEANRMIVLNYLQVSLRRVYSFCLILWVNNWWQAQGGEWYLLAGEGVMGWQVYLYRCLWEATSTSCIHWRRLITCLCVIHHWLLIRSSSG